MKTDVIYLNEKHLAIGAQNAVISLNGFCRFLEERIQAESGAKAQLFRFVLKQIRAHPELEGTIDLERISNYKQVLEYIYLTLMPAITNEKEKFWGLSVPLSPVIFYGTKALYHFLTDKQGCLRGSIVHSMEDGQKERRVLSILYFLALRRLYGFDLRTKMEMVQQLSDGEEKISHYYKIIFDPRFVEVKFQGERLPEIAIQDIHFHDQIMDVDMLNRMQELLPLKDLLFEGFSVVQVLDITTQKAIENIKNMVVNLSQDHMPYAEVASSLRSLIGRQAVDIRMIPMLRVNDKLVLQNYESVGRTLREICQRFEVAEDVYLNAIERFYKHPEVIMDESISLENSNSQNREMYTMLISMGVKGMLILPVYFNKQLVGMLEIFSKVEGAISSNTLTRLEPVIPLLEQLFQANIDDFDISLDNVVKEKFTSLQPSVQWAFNEAAWQYLQRKKVDKKALIERIRFEGVYPLYGAIDVRNSSLARSVALQADLIQQLQLLIDLIESLKKIHFLTMMDEMIFHARQYMKRIEEHLSADDEFAVSNFLETEIVSFLLHYHDSYPASEELINNYYLASGANGKAYSNRAELEESLQLLNSTIGSLLDRMNMEIQLEFPCFFEKFRTDGIEYDIYIGPSITPHRSYDPIYLRNLRLWQLTSMALVARLTRALIPQMKRKLETTQLIFIHANTIDIEFRSDEHRFDVEGAYNIRYEMIKKRIDKVRLKDSEERLTQPGKIAMIYFQQRDIEEYLSFIDYLQQQQVLNMDLEYLELEELQGVSGLKALRIGVNMETEEIEL